MVLKKQKTRKKQKAAITSTKGFLNADPGRFKKQMFFSFYQKNVSGFAFFLLFDVLFDVLCETLFQWTHIIVFTSYS